jgi:hypothetical protein
MSNPKNNNPTGHNQHRGKVSVDMMKTCISGSHHICSVAEGPELKAILQDLVDCGICKHKDILRELATKHLQYTMGWVASHSIAKLPLTSSPSASTLRKYMHKLEIITSHKNNWPGTANDVIRAVQHEMDCDPARNRGPDYIAKKPWAKGIHLPM